MGAVNISLTNGGLGGTIQTADGVVGLVITGGIDGGGYTLGTPILLTSATQLTGQGITTDGNELAVRQVGEFYDVAGDGAQLYLMLVPNTMTASMIADKDEPDGAIKLLNYADGKIKVLGVLTDDKLIGTPTISHAINAETLLAAANMKLLVAAFYALHKPFRGIVAGTSYTGVPGDLTDLTDGTSNNTCAVLIGDTEAGDSGTNTCYAAMGLLLGSIAAVPVMRKVSRVKTGALPITAAYVGLETIEAAGTDMAVIASRGYITLAKYPNVSGYFWSGDPMATATSDDYHMLARGRVIDKAHILAYTTFVQEIDDEVPVNKDGTLDVGFCTQLQQTIVNTISANMGETKEISDVRCYINPAQNILSTNVLNVVLKITPVGYATAIEVKLGFENPAL